MNEKLIKSAGKPSIDDLNDAIDWLYMMWNANAIPDGTDGLSDDFAGPILRVINMLVTTVEARELSAAIVEAKRKYAREHNISYSKVRYTPPSKKESK
jgi:hypothetical protein